MATMEVIKASEAPRASKKQSTIAPQLLETLSGLKKDEVLKFSPDDGRTIRRLKTSVGRITSNAGVKVTRWLMVNRCTSPNDNLRPAATPSSMLSLSSH